MKRSNVLLGSRRLKKTGDKTSGEGDEDDWDDQDDLLPPNKVAVADDNNAYRLFGDRIFCAPQEDILEGTRPVVLAFHAFLICRQNYTSSLALHA